MSLSGGKDETRHPHTTEYDSTVKGTKYGYMLRYGWNPENVLLSERNQPYCTIPLTWGVQKQANLQNRRARREPRAGRVVGKEEPRPPHRVPSQHKENTLTLVVVMLAPL